MLTTEYISSIYILACLLLNNTCLQFNLPTFHIRFPFKRHQQKHRIMNRAPGQAPTNSPARPSPGWGKCSGPTWRWGNPDMVQKMVQDPTSLVQKKKHLRYNVIIIWKLLSEVGSNQPPPCLLNPHSFVGNLQTLDPLQEPPHGFSGPRKRQKLEGPPSWNPRKTHGFFGGRARMYPKKAENHV